jgi:hypothetical protein
MNEIRWYVIIADKDEKYFAKVGKFYTMTEAIIFSEELDSDHIAAIMTVDDEEVTVSELTLCELAS